MVPFLAGQLAHALTFLFGCLFYPAVWNIKSYHLGPREERMAVCELQGGWGTEGFMGEVTYPSPQPWSDYFQVFYEKEK